MCPERAMDGEASPMKPISTVSLFTGIGGFDLALERVGMQVVVQVENDAACNRVLAAHWPNVRRFGDVRTVSGSDLGAVDLICGGFPCQDVSVAGRRAGLGGRRSVLWWEFHRLLSVCRPKWCLIENVPGLLSSNGGRDMGAILWALGHLGYGWAYRVLDAQWFGLAQQRARVFIVGCLGDPARAAAVLFEPESSAGDTPPRREAGAQVARTIRGGSAGGRTHGKVSGQDEWGVAYALTGRSSGARLETEGNYVPMVISNGQGDPNFDTDRAFALDTQMDQTVTVYDPNQMTSKENRSRPSPGLAHTLPASSTAPIAVRTAQTGSNGKGWSRDTAYALDGAQGQADGLPNLAAVRYNTGYASAQEANAGTLLSELRQQVGEEAFTKWGLGILLSVQPSEVLPQAMHGTNIQEQAGETSSGLEQSAPASTSIGVVRTMQDLWALGCKGCSPRGWQPSEQLSRELGSLVSQLPQPHTQTRSFLRALWQASEGLGVLRQALSTLQEVGPPLTIQKESTHATSQVGRIGGAGLGVRRLTPL